MKIGNGLIMVHYQNPLTFQSTQHTINTHTLFKENKMTDFTPKLPEVKFNKNGYELRTDILAMAKDAVQHEYQMKFQGWELSARRDEKTGQLVSTVNMPEFPGLDKILETAEKMYGFVNQGTTKK
jgi:hypothetical protein